jgi:hypothetical protein
MALQTLNHAPASLRGQIDAFFAGLGMGFNAYLERQGRIAEIERLNAMSDDELAKLGIARDRIPHHVFRDLFYL